VDRSTSDASSRPKLGTTGKQRTKSFLENTSPASRSKTLAQEGLSRSPPPVGTAVNPSQGASTSAHKAEAQSREPLQKSSEAIGQESLSEPVQPLDPSLFSFDEFALFNAQLGFSMESILPAINFGSEGFPLPDDLMRGGGAFGDGSFIPGQAVAGPSNSGQVWQQGQSTFNHLNSGQAGSMSSMEPSGMMISPPMDHEVEEEEDEVDDSAYDPMEDPIYIGLVTDKEAVDLLDE